MLHHAHHIVVQDYAGLKGQPITSPLSAQGYATVWAKPLTSQATNASGGFNPNGMAAFLLNAGGNAANVTLYFHQVGFASEIPVLVRDVVRGVDMGLFIGSYSVMLNATESRLLKLIARNAV